MALPLRAVFGTPVTQGTRTERARSAYNNRNIEGKKDQAVDFLRKAKIRAENATVTVICFYNATGEAVNIIEGHSFCGHFYDPVENGQWGVFVHYGSSCSGGFVMIRAICNSILSNDPNYCIGLLGWDTSDEITKGNHAYCDILHDDTKPNPDDVLKNIRAAGTEYFVTYNGTSIIAEIEEGSSYLLYEAILFRDVDAGNSTA